MYSTVWLEVGISHPDKIQEFVDISKCCRLKLLNVLNDFTGRSHWSSVFFIEMIMWDFLSPL